MRGDRAAGFKKQSPSSQLASHLEALHTDVAALATDDPPPQVVTLAAALRDERRTINVARVLPKGVRQHF